MYNTIIFSFFTSSCMNALRAEKLREDSEITKIFGGQLRSQLVCPDCGKVTVYFEYHRSVRTSPFEDDE